MQIKVSITALYITAFGMDSDFSLLFCIRSAQAVFPAAR
jgi:hypothetical protein